MNLFKMACRAYPHHSYIPRKQIWKLRAKWIKAIHRLGDKWLLYKSVERKSDVRNILA